MQHALAKKKVAPKLYGVLIFNLDGKPCVYMIMERMHIQLDIFLHGHAKSLDEHNIHRLESSIANKLRIMHDKFSLPCKDMILKNIMLNGKGEIRLIDFGGGFCSGVGSMRSLTYNLAMVSMDAFRFLGDRRILYADFCRKHYDAIIYESHNLRRGSWGWMMRHYFVKNYGTLKKWKRALRKDVTEFEHWLEDSRERRGLVQTFRRAGYNSFAELARMETEDELRTIIEDAELRGKVFRKIMELSKRKA